VTGKIIQHVEKVHNGSDVPFILGNIDDVKEW